MATITWPTIPGSYISDYAFMGGRTIPVELQSGAVHEVQVSSAARYWMTLHYNGLRTNRAAPSPYASSSEAKCIRDLIVLLKRGDVAQIADPIDGTTRTWRLDGDQASFRRIPKTTWWEAEIPLRSV